MELTAYGYFKISQGIYVVSLRLFVFGILLLVMNIYFGYCQEPAKVIVHDGNVYLRAGELLASKPYQFYQHNSKTHGFENFGMMAVDRRSYYYCRGQQFDCKTTGLNGAIYLGESEPKSHIFLFFSKIY